MRWQYQILFWCPIIPSIMPAPQVAGQFYGEVPARAKVSIRHCVEGGFYQAEPTVWPAVEVYDDTTDMDKWYRPASEPIRVKDRERTDRLEARETFWVDVKPPPTIGGSGSSTPIGGGYIFSKHFQYQSNFAPVITEGVPAPETVSIDRWGQPASQPALKPRHFEHLYRWDSLDPDAMIDALVPVGLDKWLGSYPDWLARKQQTQTGYRVAPVAPLVAIAPPFSFIPDIEQPSPRASASRKILYPPYFPFVTVITPPLPEVVTLDKWLGFYPERIARKREHSPPWYPELYGQNFTTDPFHLLDAGTTGPPTEAPVVRKKRGELRNEILYRLGDTTSTIWSPAEINSYISEGYNKLVLMTGVLWVKRSYSDTIAQPTMTLDADLYQIERATWRDKKIEPLVHRDLEGKFPAYRTIQGDVFGYLMEGDGLRVLRKVRVPSVTASNTLSLEFWRRPAALTSDNDSFEIPDRFLKYLRHFVMWQALERDGPGQDLELAEHYQQRWASGIARVINRKATVARQRVSRLGSQPDGDGRTPRPRLPWQYGDKIR